MQYQIKSGQIDIDLIKNQDNNISLNSSIITLKTVLSSIQIYNKYKNNKQTKYIRNKNINVNNRKTSVNNKKDNLKNKLNKKQESNNNNDDNGNNKTTVNNKQYLHNTNHYINENLIVNVKNKEKIFPEDIKLFNIEKDGNCLLRALSAFTYTTDKYHLNIRLEIADYLKNNLGLFEEVPVPTEYGDMTIEEYIEWMKTPGKWGGELEIYAFQKLYNINIVSYKPVFNMFNRKEEFIYIYNYMQNNNYKKIYVY